MPDISLIKNPTNGYWKYRAIEVYDWIGMASLQADRYEIKKLVYAQISYMLTSIYIHLSTLLELTPMTMWIHMSRSINLLIHIILAMGHSSNGRD